MRIHMLVPDAHSPDAHSPDDARRAFARRAFARPPSRRTPALYLPAGVNKSVPKSVALPGGHEVWIYGTVQGLPSTITETWRYVVSKDQGRRRPIRGAYPEKHLDMQDYIAALPDVEEEEESPYGSADEYVEDSLSHDDDDENERERA